MSLDKFKKRRMSDKDRKKYLSERGEESKRAAGKKSRIYPTMRPGGNVYMVIPHIGGAAPYRMIHYHGNNPMMKCGLPDPYREKGTGKIKDHAPWTEGCPFCNKIWDLYKEAGKPDSMKSAFNSMKSRPYLVIQVVQLTPFFDYEKGSYTWSEKNEKWFGPFVDYILNQAKIRAGEEVEPMEIPDGMPEEVSYAAQAGIGLLRIKNYNKAYYGNDLIDAYEQTMKMVRKYSDDPDLDPFYEPDTFLLSINRDFIKKASWGNEYSTKFEVSDFTDNGWEFPERLGEIFNDKYLRDIWDLNRNMGWAEDLQTRAENLADLNPDEINQLIDEIGHTFYERSGDENGDDENYSFDDDEDISGRGMSASAQNRLNKLKARMSKGSDVEIQDDDDDEEGIPF